MVSSPTEIETIELSTNDERLAAVADRVARSRGRVLIARDGVPIAAVLPAADVERLDRFDAEWEADFAVFDEMAAAFADVDPAEIERETAKAVAEVRAEMRAERAAAASR